MPRELYWLDGSWPGKLAVGSRPRGGDWLKDEIAGWKRADVNAVLSLLTPDEERSLNLRDEADEVRAQGMHFTSFPIPDRQIPRSEAKWSEVLDGVARDLSTGKNVLVHCRQGIRSSD
jgi:protein-tyrosine phosphatase